MIKREKFVLNELQRIDGEAKFPDHKHVKMAQNPFRFFRGSAQLFYADIKSQRINIPSSLNKLPNTAIVGDCHMANFGFLSEEGSHLDSVIFTVNDFDDACFGNPSWDLIRYLVSMCLSQTVSQAAVSEFTKINGEINTQYVAATENDLNNAMSTFIQAYLTQLNNIIEQPSKRNSVISSFQSSKFFQKQQQKALKRTRSGSEFTTKSALAKAINCASVPLGFKLDSGKYQSLPAHERLMIELLFRPYVDDNILDCVARLDAGTGSVNMQRYYLLVGPTNKNLKNDLPLCHVVEIKQQRQAAPLFYFPDISPNNKLNPAHLTIDCQRLMQRRADLVLDEVVWQQQNYLVRSRHHARLGIDPNKVTQAKSALAVTAKFSDYAYYCGQALALAHSRGDRRSTRFEQAMVVTVPHEHNNIINIAKQYAQQVIADTQLLQKHITAKLP